jgi:hypothetical protein
MTAAGDPFAVSKQVQEAAARERQKEEQEATAREEQRRQKAKADGAMLADTFALLVMYEQNEIRADAAFKGKRLWITGTVTGTGREILGRPYVMLNEKVQCVFAKQNEPQVADLNLGQGVTVSGDCSGKTLLHILVNNCAVVPDK